MDLTVTGILPGTRPECFMSSTVFTRCFLLGLCKCCTLIILLYLLTISKKWFNMSVIVAHYLHFVALGRLRIEDRGQYRGSEVGSCTCSGTYQPKRGPKAPAIGFTYSYLTHCKTNGGTSGGRYNGSKRSSLFSTSKL